MIEVRFTEDQFERLLKLVSTATLVINAYREDVLDEFSDIVQYLYSKAEDEGLEDLYEYEEETGEFVPSKEVEEEIFEYLHDYNEETFWRTLCTSLAIRDLEKELGKGEVEKMDFNKKIKRITPIFEKYAEEFERNGVENLILIKKNQ